MWFPALLAIAPAVLQSAAPGPGILRPALVQEPSAVSYQLRVAPAPVSQVFGHGRFEDLDPAEPALHLYMVERYGFVTLAEPRLADKPRAADGSGAALAIERLAPYRWRVDKGAATEVELSWVVPIDHRSLPAVAGRDEYQFPYLAGDHGMLTTSALLIVPELPVWGPSMLTIDPPEGWDVHGPWPRIAPRVFRPESEYALVSNLFAVGGWEAHTVEASGAEVDVLFAPGQGRLAELAVPLIAPVLKAELELFDVRPFERYTVLFGRPDGPGLGGSPKQGSMTLSVDARMVNESGVAGVLHLVAHEFFHTWGQSRYECPDELRFFNEGFTDYYSHLVPARLGSVTWSRFGEAVEKALADWETSPRATDLSLAAAGGPPFFQDKDAYQLVYQGGLALAALTDAMLRMPTLRVDGREGDLDEFMRSFNNDPRWGKRAPSVRDFRLALAERVGHGRARQLMALALRPRVPDLVRAFASAGVPLRRSLERSQTGMRANLNGTTIADMDRSGLAARLGLRKGDRVRTVNGQRTDSERELRKAWSSIETQVLIEFERDGKRERIEREVPETVRYELPLDRWTPSRSTGDR